MPLSLALIVQQHHRAVSDDEFLQLLKAHVDHGFELIKNDTSGFKSEDDYVDYLVELTRAGLEQRTQEVRAGDRGDSGVWRVARFADRLGKRRGGRRGI